MVLRFQNHSLLCLLAKEVLTKSQHFRLLLDSMGGDRTVVETGAGTGQGVGTGAGHGGISFVLETQFSS